jgi:general stress protein YciG
MGGNRKGGLKSKATLLRENPNYYKDLGRQGGKASAGGRFGRDHEYAQEMGRIGGKLSRRPKT